MRPGPGARPAAAIPCSEKPPHSGPPGAAAYTIPALDGLRGFAALWVLLFHVWMMTGLPSMRPFDGAPFGLEAFLTMGWAGVDLFFCLSAFLLVLPFARWRYAGATRPDTGRYLMRRVLRIYPAYLVQLAILLLIAAVSGHGRTLGGGELIAHLFLWFNLGQDWVAPLVGVWFTLPIEFSFYLVLPLIAPLIDRRCWPWLLLASIAVAVGYRIWAYAITAADPLAIRIAEIERLPGRIDQFVIGMLAGAAFVAASIQGWRPRRPALWFWVGVAGMVVLSAAMIRIADRYWSGHPLLYVWHGLFSLCLAPVLLACAWGARPGSGLFDNRPMRYLGKTSFGIYLWHMPILIPILPHLPASMSPAGRFWALLALVLPATLLVAHLSYVWIERPLQRGGGQVRARTR
ncbi:MAG TPA: acyltransferase [Dokdonella sp.]|uniref:acyltransferase family protein n=1 Tax=Dokdonella sp. TaxID=2291710 RepID=UPI002B64FF96|nr:acyltransferase [Dokdonella sp.]HUD43851.1 acyltransferase [Dokdonella sp.]